MFNNSQVFTSFSVDNLEKARTFYEEILGGKVEDESQMGIQFKFGSGNMIFIYPREDHAPATYTILNFIVDDIDNTVDELQQKGIDFLHYDLEGFPQDKRGIVRRLTAGMGPDIAWFEDPAGNILSVLQVS